MQIRAIQLAARIRSRGLGHGKDVAVLDVLEHPTARQLAAFIDSHASTESGDSQVVEAFNDIWLPRVRKLLGEGEQVQMVLPCLPRTSCPPSEVGAKC